MLILHINYEYMKKTILFILFLNSYIIFSQQTTSSPASFDFNDGGIYFSTADSTTSVYMRFRVQNQMIFNSVSESDLSIASSSLLTRRARVRFGGNLYDKRISYNFQFSFARNDIDLITGFPNIVRDAMVFYNPNEHIQIGFGQTKLPGNRQRVISSGDLQFSERSIINNRFNFDRDFGVQLAYINSIYEMPFYVRFAFSQGDGRNMGLLEGANFAYTGRFEFLPLGRFKNGGDYFEGDLEYEEDPKLSIGISFQRNEKSTRAGGQLGNYLFEPRDIETFIADAVFKLRGFAFYSEYANRHSPDPITINPENSQIRNIFVGEGYLFQASYTFRNFYEVAGRFAQSKPRDIIYGLNDAEFIRHTEIKSTKYLHKHRAKIGLELRHNYLKDMSSSNDKMFWSITFNTEFGI